MKYLQDKQHYIDRYDKMTVESSRRFEKNVLNNGSLDEHGKAFADAFSELIMYYQTGADYMNKESTIQKWMENDRERDRVYESAREPEGIRCRCGKTMHSTFKTIHGDDRVMFFFDCPDKCLPRRAVFDNGEEWISKKDLCPECNTELQTKSEREDGEKITTVYSCNSCDYTNTDVLDLTHKEKEIDPDYEKDRAKYCLSEEDGFKFAEHARALEAVAEIAKEHEEKEAKKDLYDEVEKLNKLSIPQIKEFFIQSLEDTNYINPVFEKPDISNIVSIGFSVEDPSNTDEYDSKQMLKKLLKTSLESTNWRLMSDGISYRLGLLTGRIRAYENDKDLVKLIEKSMK